MMIKRLCKYCKEEYLNVNSFILYCSSKCKSRDRFVEIPYGEYGKKNFKVWKDNFYKYPDFYSEIKSPKDRFKNKCLVCASSFQGFRKCCSDECSLELKKMTTVQTTGCEHNLAGNSKSRKNMESRLIENYGVSNVFQRNDVKLKLKKTWNEKYGVDNPTMNHEIKNKVKKTNIDRGNWIGNEIKDEFSIYCYHIDYFTNRNINKFAWKYWGKDFYKNWGFHENHVDHIYSKKEGFVNGIPAFIIGSFVNLRMIKGTENMKKGTKCDIDIESLYQNYYKFFEDNQQVIQNINDNFKEVLKYRK
jgi:hypothetical protein